MIDVSMSEPNDNNKKSFALGWSIIWWATKTATTTVAKIKSITLRYLTIGNSSEVQRFSF
jgi:hypothetical protein